MRHGLRQLGGLPRRRPSPKLRRTQDATNAVEVNIDLEHIKEATFVRVVQSNHVVKPQNSVPDTEIAYYGKGFICGLQSLATILGNNPWQQSLAARVANPRLGIVSDAREKKRRNSSYLVIIANQSFKLQKLQTMDKRLDIAMKVALALMVPQEKPVYMSGLVVSRDFFASLSRPCFVFVHFFHLYSFSRVLSAFLLSKSFFSILSLLETVVFYQSAELASPSN